MKPACSKLHNKDMNKNAGSTMMNCEIEVFLVFIMLNYKPLINFFSCETTMNFINHKLLTGK